MKNLAVLSNSVSAHGIRTGGKGRNRVADLFKRFKNNLSYSSIEMCLPENAPQDDMTWDSYGNPVYKNNF